MADHPAPTDPGPTWMWLTAWSFQGACVVGANAVGLQGDVAPFLLMGAVAAVPLIGLNLVLRSRGRST